MKSLFGCIFLLLLLNLGPTSRAQDLTVYTEEFPPCGYMQEGKVSGMSVELVQEILSDIKYSVTIQLVPWARAYEAALTQKNVALFTVVKSKEREPLFHWIGPVCKMKSKLYKLSEDTKIPVVHKIEELKPFTIGTVNGWADEKYLTNLGFLKLESVAETKQNIFKLLSRRVDLIQDYDSNIALKMRELGLSPDLITPVLNLDVNPSELYLVLSKKTPAHLVQQIRESYHKVIESEKGKAIVKRWGSSF